MNTTVAGQNETKRAWNKSTVLIIDFDPDSLLSLTNFVQAEGFEVITARDGLTGWDLFRAQHPDLVIMEAMLPKLNGFELCKKIVSDSRGATPVIMITGIYREISYRIEALQIYGASAFYSKPWNKEDLKHRIYQLLNLDDRGAFRKKPEKATISAEPSPKQETAAAPAKESSKPNPPEPNPRMGTTMINNADDTHSHLRQPEQKIPAKEKKASLDQDIEGMLKDTLAGLGLAAEIKKQAGKVEIPRAEFRRAEAPRPETFRSEPPKAAPVKAEPVRMDVPKTASPAAGVHRQEKPEPRPAEPPRQGAANFDFPQVDNLRAQIRRAEAIHPETITSGVPKREPKPVEKQILEVPKSEIPRAEKAAAGRPEFIPAAKEGKKPGIPLDISEAKAFQKAGERETMDIESVLPREPEEKRARKAAEAVFPVTADKAWQRAVETPEPEPAVESRTSFGIFVEAKKKSAPLMIGGLVLGFLLVSGTFYLILKPKKAALVELADTPVSSEAAFINYTGDSLGVDPEQSFRALKERLSALLPGASENKPAAQKKAPEKPAAFQAEPAVAPSLDAASQLKLDEQPEQKNETAAGTGIEVNPAAQDPKPVDPQSKTAMEPVVPSTKPGDLVPYAEIDVAPEITKRVEAQYPQMARKMGTEGSITVNALISETGSVIRTEILKGLFNSFGLEKAAENAVKQWKFSPAQKAGVPVKVWKAIMIVFQRDE